ncbi:elongation factor G [Chloroflexota bacterium]
MQHPVPDQIRNVILLSHSGAGKTSLAEAMLFTAGAISRLGRVDEGTTASDYELEETKRKISISLAVLPCTWKGVKINLLDTPGYADFAGEVKAGLRVCEGGIVVVGAAEGIEVGTERVWAYAEEAHLPRLLLVNKMDRENADFERTMQDIQARLGKKCVPLQVPVGSQTSFKGVVDLIAMKGFIGPKGQETDIAEEVREVVAHWKEKLVESVAELDEELLVKYLDGKEITASEIEEGLRRATVNGKLVPVLVGSGLQNVGMTSLMDAVVKYLPLPGELGLDAAVSPATQKEEKLECNLSSPLSALIFKSSADPYVGKLTYFRVYSGAINSNSQVWNATRSSAEKIGQLYLLRGKTQEGVPQVGAGDIGAVAKLTTTSTGDTLCQKDHPLVLDKMSFLPTAYSMAVWPKTKADLDKLGMVLPRLTEEDPTLELRREAGTGELLLSGLGDVHLEVAVEKLARKFGVEVKLELPKVPYRETLTTPVKAEYKHKKQTGGHGQYGHVFLELEPLARGSGNEFGTRVVGGKVPKNYFAAVEKGVNEAFQEGVLAHYPVADVKATLYDGSSHAVDSSDMAFKLAAMGAMKKGLSEGHSVLLEPVMNVTVTVPESFTGDVIGDLNTKRARVLGMNREGAVSIIEAQLPMAEVLRYATDLRSITQGRGSYTMEFSHYEEVPAPLVAKVVADREAERAAKA